MKVICAGLSKTGTKTVREVLEILKYKNVHDFMEQIKLDHQIFRKALIEGDVSVSEFREWFADVDAVTGTPAAFFWRELFDAFPDSKVILMVRDSPEQWLGSFETMMKTDLAKIFFFKYFKAFEFFFVNKFNKNLKNLMDIRHASWQRLAKADAGWNNVSLEYAKEYYIKHNQEVIDYCPEDQLLIYNVKDGWEPLCKFLGKDVPDVPFPKLNVKSNMATKVLEEGSGQAAKFHDAGMTKILMDEIKRTLIIYVIILLVIVSCVVFIVL